LRSVAPASFDKKATINAGDELVTTPDHAAGNAPKKEPNRSGTRKPRDRVVQQAVERRGSSWNFSSSPASPNYR
jgi:hypothetical protein